ncbi:hypothetical protein A5645_05100 [Mycobacterium asiaticum]|uniref:hypothetical protein n=1 Tax=Mycobacterium asiaticum TaxID=1790 RepID=UPI0007EFD64A|nr:hypothetical protein [Mycobacterium asiaticum]OBK97873.1 hypothetical protein A5645_05100 [Mycobacterium asiaticum]
MSDSPTTAGPPGPRDQRTVANAARFAGAVVVVALLVLFLTVMWASGCKSGSGDQALEQCGALRRNALAFGSPLILLLGGLAAFVRAYRVWLVRGRWWVWQGIGWFLLALMLAVLFMAVPASLL